MHKIELEKLLLQLIEEDLKFGDITSDAIFHNSDETSACIFAKAEGVIAGVDIVEKLIKLYDNTLNVEKYLKDGQKIKPGEKILKVSGKTKSILALERSILNIMSHMSGIATKTNKFVEIANKYNVKIVDTRKTLPGLRSLQKYAVTVGGGFNHRYGLYDSILIKDNHIAAAGSEENAIRNVKQKIGHTVKIEIEVTNLNQVVKVLDEGVDIILLDNMTEENMTKAVELIGDNAITEASGNISLETIESVCQTGIDVVSVGGLTHSVTALDLSLMIK